MTRIQVRFFSLESGHFFTQQSARISKCCGADRSYTYGTSKVHSRPLSSTTPRNPPVRARYTGGGAAKNLRRSVLR